MRYFNPFSTLFVFIGQQCEFRYCKIIEIEEGEYPINEYKKWIEEALSLSGDKSNSIDFNVEQENKVAKKICFKKFNLKTRNNKIENKMIEIDTCDTLFETLKIAAFCLTSKIGEKIKCIDLQKQKNETFCFPDDVTGKWIVYNKEQSASASFKPCLRDFGDEERQNIDPLEKAISMKNENERIKEIQEVLKNDTHILSDSWQTIAQYAIFFKEQGIPLDIADYFKAILRNQQLAARFFFVLMLYLNKDTWFADVHNMVKDQNFGWRFISIKVWEEELSLIRKANYHEIILKMLEENFKKIREEFYEVNKIIHEKEIGKSFGLLCGQLLEERWPTWSPDIPYPYKKCYKRDRYVENKKSYQRGIFYAPLLAALLAIGKYDVGWNDKPENYFRYLICCYATDNTWFDKAYEFFYQRLQKEEVQ
jgi:hypothetical protein